MGASSEHIAGFQGLRMSDREGSPSLGHCFYPSLLLDSVEEFSLTLSDIPPSRAASQSTLRSATPAVPLRAVRAPTPWTPDPTPWTVEDVCRQRWNATAI